MNEQEVHRKFSTECFNEVWGLMEKASRSMEEDRLMREMAHASLFHWLKRDDRDATKISIGLWLVSRVYSMMGDGGAASRYAGECIEISASNSLPPFYMGYGYEAAARAAGVAGEVKAKVDFLKNATDELGRIEDAGEKEMLEKDLEELTSEVRYQTGGAISVEDFRDLLNRSNLGERRPVADEECLAGMLENSNLLVTAWDGEKLVGVARSVTDFHYACYLSDLAVDEDYQRQGIGTRLQQVTQEHLGPMCKLILISAPAANDYYPALGYEASTRCWVLPRERECGKEGGR